MNWKGIVPLILLVLFALACGSNISTESDVVATAAATATVEYFPTIPSESVSIDVHLWSDLGEGKCLAIGESFIIGLDIKKPSSWEGPTSASVQFQVAGTRPTGQVIVQNTTQQLSFEQMPGTTARGSIGIKLSLPNGETVSFGNPNFPYFDYKGQKDGEFCFSLPAEIRQRNPQLHSA